MLRSWCFYSQSIGYKSWLKDRWHTCSSQTAGDRAGMWSLEVQLKFNNLCCHLDPALQFGCEFPTCVHVPFSKVSISFAHPVCGINPLQEYLVLCACSDKSQIAEVREYWWQKWRAVWAVSWWYFLHGCFNLVEQWGMFGFLSEVRLQCRQLLCAPQAPHRGSGYYLVSCFASSSFSGRNHPGAAFNRRAAGVTWAAKVPRM